ncbi:MAG: mechanosensitive ion channel [Sphingomonadales bacterium]|nr:MAG: mechanosensitive ion channel [Sphingomonadales bacterium]
MQRFGEWLAAYGFPTAPDLSAAAVAAGLAVAALAIGWLAGRHLGARVTELWAKRAGGMGEGLGPRMTGIFRHGVAALLLAIISAAWPWPPLAALGLGLATGAATAMLAVFVLRGLNLPRWAAWTLAALAFTAILSHAIGGFSVVETTLDRVGVQVGARRFTLLSVLTVAVTVLLLFAAVRLINRMLSHSISEARGFDPTQKLLIQKLAGIAAVVMAFFIGVDLLEIDLTAFAIFSGAFGLAIGFGLQKTVGNLIAGIILLMDRSIKPGDIIVVGESFGWVNKIGVRAVSVITRDGKEHLIPNEILMTQEVENWSYTDRNVRVRIPVTVSYDCDLAQAQELMLKAVEDSPRALASPSPTVRLSAFGDNGAEHEILCWISDPEGGVGNVKSDVLNRLWLMFKEARITVPVTQREVRIVAMPGKEPAATA